MALDTFANLKTQIIDFSHRGDISNRIDDFIVLAEEAMYANPDFPLQLRQMETRAEATTGPTRFLALPDGFITMRRLKLNIGGGSCDVQYMAPDQMAIQSASGQPRFFTVTSQLEFDRVPDSTYTVDMQYSAIPTPLSAANPTNIVLTNHPSAYLYGALTALFGWANDTENEANYQRKFFGIIQGINKRYKQGRYGPAPKMRIEGATP
ncbi:MAG: hypothetical protein JKY52_09330 [Flavobacteriales bacterium]|nr:hypothetical protein [Flavobacteriales bacterium]